MAIYNSPFLYCCWKINWVFYLAQCWRRTLKVCNKRWSDIYNEYILKIHKQKSYSFSKNFYVTYPWILNYHFYYPDRPSHILYYLLPVEKWFKLVSPKNINWTIKFLTLANKNRNFFFETPDRISGISRNL